MPIPTCASPLLTFQRKLLPLLVNTKGKCWGRNDLSLSLERAGMECEKDSSLYFGKTDAQMWGRLNSIITFGFISFVRVSVSSERQKMPTVILSNPREWEQSLPFSEEPAALAARWIPGVRAHPELHTGEPCQAGEEGDGSLGHYKDLPKSAQKMNN